MTTQNPQTSNQNPSQRAGNVVRGDFKRVPMSVPRQRLSVPSLPGYYLYWMLESNVPRAQAAGYEFVLQDDLPVNQRGVGTDSQISGNADLGSHVRVVAGLGPAGEPEYHVLMKLREEWYLEDQNALQKANSQRLSAIFGEGAVAGDSQLPSGSDASNRYVKKALLQRPIRKS